MSSHEEESQGDVGYGKPPKQHRFKKGQSGNPRGRPKKPKVPKGQGLDFGTQPANILLMEEAYRTVALREGDRVIRLPAIQAVFRAMNVAALKGNRFAQRTFAELVQNIEDQDRKLRTEFVGTAIEYKIEWERAIEDAKARGLPEPQPIPHPDDMIVDLERATVHTNGPSTREQKAKWDDQIARRDEAQQLVTEYASLSRRARDPAKREFFLQEQLFEQKIFDIINDSLPRRYQTKLEHRSWAPGASRAGERRQAWPGEE